MLIKIKHYLQRNSRICCYHLKRKKRRMMVGFIASKYKKCLYVLYQKQLPEVYRGQGGKGGVLTRHRCKETKILLINTVAFFWVEVNPWSANPTRYSNTLKQLSVFLCLSVFDHFVKLALKRLKTKINTFKLFSGLISL